MAEVELPRLQAKPMTGEEVFHKSHEALEPRLKLYKFWQWACSDLVDNLFRGSPAEFYVASALDSLHHCLRDGSGCHDITTQTGITIQVKSSAYLQSWFQNAYSRIEFDIAPKKSWNPNTNAFEGVPQRHSAIYVFCLLEHKDKSTLDPMDLDQWVFYVIPTKELPSRNSLTLTALLALGPTEARYQTLKQAIEDCAKRASCS